jgi:integrase
VSATPALTAAQRQLVEVYAAEGCGHEKALSAARQFLAQHGSVAAWCEMDLAAQAAQPERTKSFVSWLLVSRRVTATPEYLVTVRPKLGVLGRQVHPRLHAEVDAAAVMLGYGPETRRQLWSALMRTVALSGRDPRQLRQEHLDEARLALEAARQRLKPRPPRLRKDHPGTNISVPDGFRPLENVLFHARLCDQLPRRQPGRDRDAIAASIASEWARIPEPMRSTMRDYLDQVRVTARQSTVKRDSRALRDLGLFLAQAYPGVTGIADIRRPHIEAFKKYLATRRHHRSVTARGLSPVTIVGTLSGLSVFFSRLVEWGSDDRPAGQLLFRGDYPAVDDPLPRFLDDAAAAKLMQAARQHPDLLTRLVIELLARTGMRKGELVRLSLNAVVQIGSAYWLRIPVGKLRNDRYVPLHPELKTLIDQWLAERPEQMRSDLLLIKRGRPVSDTMVDTMLANVARQAGIGHVTAHQLRHTLGTQAVNRGMSLDAIAALLGHRDLAMTKVYARIADRTVADQYFAVTEKVEALYTPPGQHTPALPATAESKEMQRLRGEMSRRMLGNGYCARPADMDCHFETVCESCTFFVTTIEFRPAIERQRDDAAAKGQLGRQKIYDGLLERLDQQTA